jgi:hypothetical protein
VSEEGKATKQIAERNLERSSGVTGVREFRRADGNVLGGGLSPELPNSCNS